MGTHEKPGISRREILLRSLEVVKFAVPASVVLGGEYLLYHKVNGILFGRDQNPPTLPRSLETKLPSELPAAVAAMQYAVVEISTNTSPITNAQSGIILDPYHVLTSGHGFRDETGNFLPFVGCKNGVSINGRDATGHPIQAKTEDILSIYQFGNYRFPDVSLIKTTTPMGNFDDIPPVVLSKTAVGKNESLYFINYQSNAQHQLRDPLSKNSRLQNPAIYAGYAFDVGWNGYIAADLSKSYGEPPDDRLRPAASGGPVFNQLGQLVGISNMSAYNDREALVLPITHDTINILANTLIQKPDACQI